MKTKKILFGMFAALALTGCSSDDVADNGGNQISDGTASYLTVQILNASETGTRATGDGKPETTSTYEDGTATENAVSSVRFYFFTDDGTGAAIKNDGTNYLDWANPGTSATGTSAPVNVEKVLEAHLVISTKAGDKIPSKLLAVLNPTSTIKALSTTSHNVSLDELRHQVEDYATLANDKNAPTFVMVNSVYKNTTSGSRVSVTDIPSTKLKKTQAEAESDPVDMYVERNVARLQFSYVGTDGQAASTVYTGATGGTLLPVYEKKDDGTYVQRTVGNDNVWLANAYWYPVATTENAYLSKHINTTWKDILFGSNVSWNYENYHRSFWAVNPNIESSNSPSGDQAGYQYYSYNQIYNPTTQTVGLGFDLTSTTTNKIYLNENAGTKDDGEQRAYPSQVLVCGQLVTGVYDELAGTYSIKPLEIGNFGGAQYIGEDELIEAMLPSIQLYKKTTAQLSGGGTETVVVGLDVTDVELETCNDDYLTTTGATIQDNTGGRYKVRLKLKSSVDVTTIVKTQEKDAVTATAEEITAAFKSVEGQIRKDGLTYYWLKIPHLSEQNIGKYGVVRNHIYDIKAEKIVGFGTPVYDPDKTIYPEDPTVEETYIAARINILQWRVVSKTVNLGE